MTSREARRCFCDNCDYCIEQRALAGGVFRDVEIQPQMMTDKVETAIEAAKQMDWRQVVLNGGPPCFYLEHGKVRRFCGRAERWMGHCSEVHEFVSLAAAIEAAIQRERNRCDALVQKARLTPTDLRSISAAIRSGMEAE